MFGQSNFLAKMLHTSCVFRMLQILSFKYYINCKIRCRLIIHWLLLSADSQGRAADLFPWETFPLGRTYRHCRLSHLCGESAGHLCSLHPRHLRPHRWVIGSIKHVHLEALLLFNISKCVFPLQEPPLPPASSSSYLESSTSELFPRNRSPCCPDQRFRYDSAPPAEDLFTPAANMSVNLCHFVPPPGDMLRCSGLHLHGHEFVIHHHWLGDWGGPKWRWTLKQKTLRLTGNAPHRAPTKDPPVIKLPLTCRKLGCTKKRGTCRETAKELKQKNTRRGRTQNPVCSAGKQPLLRRWVMVGGGRTLKWTRAAWLKLSAHF